MVSMGQQNFLPTIGTVTILCWVFWHKCSLRIQIIATERLENFNVKLLQSIFFPSQLIPRSLCLRISPGVPSEIHWKKRNSTNTDIPTSSFQLGAPAQTLHLPILPSSSAETSTLASAETLPLEGTENWSDLKYQPWPCSEAGTQLFPSSWRSSFCQQVDAAKGTDLNRADPLPAAVGGRPISQTFVHNGINS